VTASFAPLTDDGPSPTPALRPFFDRAAWLRRMVRYAPILVECSRTFTIRKSRFLNVST
jgi:hypothetical protein